MNAEELLKKRRCAISFIESRPARNHTTANRHRSRASHVRGAHPNRRRTRRCTSRTLMSIACAMSLTENCPFQAQARHCDKK
jgi:hypothetical protein